VTPRLTVQAANGGERWVTQTSQAIRWATQGIDRTANVRIELATDGKAPNPTFTTLFDSTPNTGTVNWTVQGPPTQNALIRITALDASGVSDTSNSVFQIVDPTIKLISPNGGQEWLIGSRQQVSWSSDGVTGNVDIDISRDGGRTWSPLFTDIANDGNESFTVDGAASTQARIRVKMHSRPDISAQSARNFTISTPQLTVTAPTASSRAVIGQRLTISWSGSVVRVGGGKVDVQLSRDGGATWSTIIADTANDGLVSWSLVTAPATTRAKIRVIWKPNPSVKGDSAQFSIST